MKGSDKVISALQKALHSELVGVHQYVLHAAMLENWNYFRLSELEKKRSITEMKHADALIDRILFLEGRPEVTTALEIKVGFSVLSIINNDAAIEKQAVEDYNSAVKVAAAEGDNGSRSMLEEHLVAEEEHLNYLEGLQRQIKDMGIENFLAEQTKE